MASTNTFLISLLVMALIGVIDEFFFHYKEAKLIYRKESYFESVLHTIRLFVYGALFYLTANFVFSGIYAKALFCLLIFDLVIGVLDILVEPKSREKIGGLSGVEYLLHMLLSFNLGILYFNYMPKLWYKFDKSSEVISVSDVHPWLQGTLSLFGILSIILGLIFTFIMFKPNKPAAS